MSYPIIPDTELTKKEEETRIAMSSVMADMKKPFLTVTNRWAYLERFLPIWKGYIRSRLYAIVCGAIGVAAIIPYPIIGVVSLGAAVYFWRKHIFYKSRIESERTIIIGH